jgi:hypothetical protein
MRHLSGAVLSANSMSMNPEDQADDTSIPFMDEKFFRDFLEGKISHAGQVGFPENLQHVMAEMNRRLARQQIKFLVAQNRMLESQEAVAQSLTWATWVLSLATIVLAGATVVLVVKTV